ncbi:hypothetical protein QA646_17840 [Rhizobium sp. CB3090]|uniref:hypothetical protein n=1 Tax=Rhizobium sp. CB3090 TaxID=3039156 RepID=UPI0024B0BB07|nr:hypothetical protein [Rhizobium sp. CB3090]WFU09108.1 hypothetical protein QA646_17840 [Rhizobium sp. CB3090]
MNRTLSVLVALLLLPSAGAWADCKSIADAAKRLSCYDGQNRSSANTVNLKIDVSGTNPPIFSGSTNLADGTMIQYQFRGDVPGCYGECGLANSAFVKDGKFQFVADIRGGSPLYNDNYTLDIITNESTGHLQIPFGDATDTTRMVRYTARYTVSNTSTTEVLGSARFLPFRLDERYMEDEFAHGHRVDN